MYLMEGYSGNPLLTVNADELSLNSFFFDMLPVSSMTTLWELDRALQYEWSNHFAEVFLNSSGNARRQACARSSDLFQDWMASSRNPSLFKSVKLSEFAERTSITSALMLAPDVYCEGCDEDEPAFVFYGTNESNRAWHEQYKDIKKVLSHGMFGMYPELLTCHGCNPNGYITPLMAAYARRRPNLCECMPCRGGL